MNAKQAYTQDYPACVIARPPRRRSLRLTIWEPGWPLSIRWIQRCDDNPQRSWMRWRNETMQRQHHDSTISLTNGRMSFQALRAPLAHVLCTWRFRDRQDLYLVYLLCIPALFYFVLRVVRLLRSQKATKKTMGSFFGRATVTMVGGMTSLIGNWFSGSCPSSGWYLYGDLLRRCRRPVSLGLLCLLFVSGHDMGNQMNNSTSLNMIRVRETLSDERRARYTITRNDGIMYSSLLRQTPRDPCKI